MLPADGPVLRKQGEKTFKCLLADTDTVRPVPHCTCTPAGKTVVPHILQSNSTNKPPEPLTVHHGHFLPLVPITPPSPPPHLPTSPHIPVHKHYRPDDTNFPLPLSHSHPPPPHTHTHTCPQALQSRRYCEMCQQRSVVPAHRPDPSPSRV